MSRQSANRELVDLKAGLHTYVGMSVWLTEMTTKNKSNSVLHHFEVDRETDKWISFLCNSRLVFSSLFVTVSFQG